MKNWFKTNTDSSPKDKKWWKPNISWLKLDKWVKRLDIYIIKKFLGTYFFAIALIISIAVVFDVNENIDRFINNKAPLKAIVFDYYMNFIPYFSNLFSPLFVFIAVIFFTSKLAENSEIIAMFSTGMSFKRMMRPYMISAAIISVVTFGLGAYVIPKGNVTRLDFEDRYKKKKKQEYVRTSSSASWRTRPIALAVGITPPPPSGSKISSPIARQRERERSCRPIFPPSAGATCTTVSRPLCARRSRRAFRCWGGN